MKNLIISFIAPILMTVAGQRVQAQGDFNNGQLNQTRGLRFINSVEINPVENEGIPQGTVSLSKVANQAASVNIPKKDLTYPANNSIEKCTSLQFKFALLLDVEVETLAQSALYYFIEDWYGTRYRYGGTSRDGIDCSGFTSRLVKDVYGISLPRTAREQFRATTMIANSDMREGDLVFFNTRGGVSHVGIYVGNQYFVHSSTSSGVTISNLRDDYYSKRFLGAGRFNVLNN